MIKKVLPELYSKFQDQVWPVDLSYGLRKTKWNKKCPSCGKLSLISYSSAWEIIKNKSKGNCKQCAGRNNNSGQFKKGHNSWTLGLTGEKHPSWQGGKTKEKNKYQNSREFKIFKKTVLIRDNHKCVLCLSCKKLEIDHIKPIYLYPELMFDVTNGRTLCHSCHIKTDTYGPKVKKLKRVENV